MNFQVVCGFRECRNLVVETENCKTVISMTNSPQPPSGRTTRHSQGSGCAHGHGHGHGRADVRVFCFDSKVLGGCGGELAGAHCLHLRRPHHLCSVSALEQGCFDVDDMAVNAPSTRGGSSTLGMIATALKSSHCATALEHQSFYKLP